MATKQLPLREEFEGWSPAQVAEFLKQFGMNQCSSVVEKMEMNGLRFLNISEIELSKFNILQQPHLQKMVRDIKKNEGGFMDKFKKITNKAPPNVPRRDYAAENAGAEDDQWSDDFDSDYENPDGQSDSETYVVPSEDYYDDSYEPPPTEEEKKKVSPAFSYSKGEYADNQAGNSKQQPFNKLLPGLPTNPSAKPSPPLPKLQPQPTPKSNPPLPKPNPPLATPRNITQSKPQSLERMARLPPTGTEDNVDEDDYIVPVDEEDEVEDEDDNYIHPTEEVPPLPLKAPSVNRAVKPTLPAPAPAPAVNSKPVLYEVCEQEAKRSPPQSRNMWKSPPQPKPEDTEMPTEDEYEICDPDDPDCSGNHVFKPAPTPSPLPRIGMKIPNIPNLALALQARQNMQPKDEKPTPVERRKGSNPGQEPPALPQIPPIMPKPALPKPATPPKPPEPASRSFNLPARNNVSASVLTAEQEAGVYSKEWYASSCDRKTAEEALLKSSKDGAFLIRKSSGQDLKQPYTLVVLFNKRVYNIPVRYIESTRQYALGREKNGEERFSSVAEMVQNHQRSPLVLIDSQNNTKDSTKLRHAVRVN
ncbi:B-cell linker protein isoform X2 [Ambystoma mexicanum]|uniref:B-cell linker protein isoform X2 n=1 Tax=Ambystoma mexicanum TaxID=8296 RepID=UPI0037E84666